jgi:hypothetical protein
MAKEKCSNYQILETRKQITENLPDQHRFPNSLRESKLKELTSLAQIMPLHPQRPFHQHSADIKNGSCSSKIAF